MHIGWLAKPLALACAGMLAVSCSAGGNGQFAGSDANAAKDQIMLVRREPPSFGFRRLGAVAEIYPDMKVFVARKGVPDFLAETRNRERQYFIFYYLPDREAFACRTTGRHSVEFAGPYPITDREFRLLSNFRRDPSQRLATF